MVPSVVAVVKFTTNENVNPAEIVMRLRAQFDDETLSRTEISDCSKTFEEGRTGVENM